MNSSSCFVGCASWTVGRVSLRRRLRRPEIAAARSYTVIASLFTGDFDFELTPGAVHFRVRRDIAKGVLGADFGRHLLVHPIELLDRQRKEGLAAGDIGNLLEQHALLVLGRCRLVL